MRNSRSFLVISFLILSLIQLFYVYNKIRIQERIINNGETYLFVMQENDPLDLLRGTYLELYFKENSFKIKDSFGLKPNQRIWVELRKDADGFAHIKQLYLDIPKNLNQVVEAKIGSVSGRNDETIVYIDYPFKRFYYNEGVAKQLDSLQFQTSSDTKTSFARVIVWKGNAIVDEIYINGIRINK